MLAIALCLAMYLGDQGAGGIDYLQVSLVRLLHHRRRYPVGAEDDQGVSWYIGDILNKGDTAGLEVLHNAAIVDDLMEYEKRCAVQLEGPFDGLDGTDHPCTKPPWLSEYDFHGSRVNTNKGKDRTLENVRAQGFIFIESHPSLRAIRGALTINECY
jgi:hypothetical protein